MHITSLTSFNRASKAVFLCLFTVAKEAERHEERYIALGYFCQVSLEKVSESEDGSVVLNGIYRKVGEKLRKW